MMISTKGRYALRIMTELAAAEGEDLVPLRDVVRKQEISEKYMEAIIKSLVKAGLVIGLRGKGGGYRLARPAGECTVWDILEAAEGSLAPVACLEADRTHCARADQCLTLPIWKGLERTIRDYFSGITLAQLLRQTEDGSQQV